MRIVVKVGTSTLAHPTGRLNIRRVEELAAGQGKATGQLSREEFLALWAQAKAQLKHTR